MCDLVRDCVLHEEKKLLRYIDKHEEMTGAALISEIADTKARETDASLRSLYADGYIRAAGSGKCLGLMNYTILLTRKGQQHLEALEQKQNKLSDEKKEKVHDKKLNIVSAALVSLGTLAVDYVVRLLVSLFD